MNETSQPALIEVYLRKRPELLRFFAMRLGSPASAEDLVQDIYVRIVSGTIGDVTNPSAYLYRLGSNLMLDRIKKERRGVARDTAWRQHAHPGAGTETVAELPPADEALASRERLAKLIEAVQGLPPQCQRAFRLHKFEGLSHAETAAAMGISRSAVEKHISNALRVLLDEVGP